MAKSSSLEPRLRAQTNVGSHLSKRAELGGHLEAVVDVFEGRRFTFQEINRRADQLARALFALGLRKGDRVAVLLPNGYRYVEVYYGAARAGIILVPLNLRLVADEVAFILRDSGACALIGCESHADLIADLHGRTGDHAVPDVQHWITVGRTRLPAAHDYDALIEAAPSEPVEVVAGGADPMFIMYTSGTTGRPKGTVQTHDSVQWSLLTVVISTDMRYRDRYLISMPMYHIAAFNNMGTTLYRGGVIVILQRFDAAETWRVLRDERINITLAVPVMLTQLLATYDAERHTPLALRWILSGAQAMPLPLLKSFQAMGFEIYQAYGLTEAGGVGCCMSPEDAPIHPTSIGKGFFHTEVRVVDPSGRECPPNVAGELIIRGKHIMAEYWNLPDQTADTIRDGWLHTGDVAEKDADGFLYIRDRLKDMIISGGENIYPAEIEAVLVSHPHIVDVSVIGVPSAKWGESPMAVVVRRESSLDEATVRAYCEGKIARFKLPKFVRFVEQIPRNATGKALKRVLREQFADAPGE